MAVVAGILLSLRPIAGSNRIATLAIAAAFVACLASLSSGPYLMAGALLLFLVLGQRTSLIKPLLWLVVLAAVLVEVLSNRHFYHLIDYLALSPATAWYRTRLLEVGISHLSEWWAFGVGSNWPNHWAQYIDGRDHVDMVNYFLNLGLRGGVLAIGMYVASHVQAVRHAVTAYGSTSERKFRVLIFMLGGTLLAIDLASLSFSLEGPTLLMSYIVLGALVAVGIQFAPAEEEQPQTGDTIGISGDEHSIFRELKHRERT